MKNDPRSRNPTHSTCRSRAFCSCTSRMTNDCSGPAGPRRLLSSPASPSIACILAGTSVCAPSRSGPPSTLCVLRPVRASAGVALARACCPPPCRVSTAVHAGVAAPLLIRRVAVVLIVMPTVAVVATPADAIHIAVAVVLLLLVLVAARRTPSLPRLVLQRRHRAVHFVRVVQRRVLLVLAFERALRGFSKIHDPPAAHTASAIAADRATIAFARSTSRCSHSSRMSPCTGCLRMSTSSTAKFAALAAATSPSSLLGGPENRRFIGGPTVRAGPHPSASTWM
mmetsp:Transcript_37082/g.98292  ORF Transcript_37082/g.98292 Transcript_37082/m.98292 type:complete len:283 (-) Transcript_37082:830-1678(-)